MFYLIKLLTIVLAVSIDGFGVGITYGMRKMKITLPALLIIMTCSGTIVWLSMSLGQLIRGLISPAFTDLLGGLIFIFLGLFVLFTHVKEILGWSYFNRHVFSPFTRLLRHPQQADRDFSGTISSGEALVLGVALAMDAFGAGLAASIIGYPVILMIVCIATMSGFFLFSGVTLGHVLAKSKAFEKLSLLPPLLLITIGVFNLF
jgi:putative sporulation protein YtaF